MLQPGNSPSRNATTCRDDLLLARGLMQTGLLLAEGAKAADARVFCIRDILLLV